MRAPEKAVLKEILLHATPEGDRSYPSLNTLAAQTSYARSRVQEAITFLRGQALIEIVQRGSPTTHRSTQYRVDLGKLQAIPSPRSIRLDTVRAAAGASWPALHEPLTERQRTNLISMGWDPVALANIEAGRELHRTAVQEEASKRPATGTESGLD